MNENFDLRCGDALEELKTIESETVDLVLTDPPYNIGVKTEICGKKVKNGWDEIDNYINWCIDWLQECERVLKPNGVLYFWHNDIQQVSELLCQIREKTGLGLRSFCIWDKGDAYRAQSWINRDSESRTALRSWFNVCEYCLHFFKVPGRVGALWGGTGLDMINSNPECYKPLKEWYQSEKDRLGITEKDIARKYTEETGKNPHLLRHYFPNSQFRIPTRESWERVYIPLGFSREYENLRREYENLRHYHRCDSKHCNVWHEPPVPSTGRFHTCQKPVKILERLINVSCPPDGVVLDCFMGSGSTGVACANTGRRFIGIEKDEKYCEISKQRIEAALVQQDQMQLCL